MHRFTQRVSLWFKYIRFKPASIDPGETLAPLEAHKKLFNHRFTQMYAQIRTEKISVICENNLRVSVVEIHQV